MTITEGLRDRINRLVYEMLEANSVDDAPIGDAPVEEEEVLTTEDILAEIQRSVSTKDIRALQPEENEFDLLVDFGDGNCANAEIYLYVDAPSDVKLGADRSYFNPFSEPDVVTPTSNPMITDLKVLVDGQPYDDGGAIQDLFQEMIDKGVLKVNYNWYLDRD